MSELPALDRAALGAAVRDRLAAVPGIFHMPAPIDIFLLRNFLSGEECAGLIALIDADRQPSTLFAPDRDPAFRTSESCNLKRSEPLVHAIEQRLSTLTGIDPAYGETVQGQRYAPGQQFKPHHDFFHTDQPYWPHQEKIGGQRTWTAMIFLNQPETGGQTDFPEAGIRVTPRTGNLLAWNNLDALGEPELRTLHQGLPVEAGMKYVITKWFRERPWG
ncbi:prolyl hydroxylase family protein [Allosphingosinicella indica]|uniref:Prolyl 4-hydroxylase n=1 Tax=Allosphingosinicella indica TaxID=941907 RepID=A0A1X7FZJ4_9SPHN|nr:2OG-Fe(II) oxygenase [Allosphingosinicella indica]SMF61538.1 prolyl 4-hydroxylase [Allosphingosinicella indica]